MTDPALIEAMARAIYPKIAWAYKWDGNTPFDELNDHAIGVLLDTATAALAAHDAWLRSAGMTVDLELARRRLGELNECAPISDCPDCEQGLTTSCLRRAEAVLGEN